MTQDLIDQLRGLLAASTQGEWTVQDGCSWRRIGTPFSDGDVLCPVTQRDGHPDLAADDGKREHNLRLIVAAVNALPDLLDTIEAQARRIEALTAALEQAVADFEDIAQLALKQIDAGEEHGARVWRIALQDIAKEADDDRQDARAALHIRDGE